MNRSAQPLPSGARCEGGRALDAEEAEFPLEVVAGVLRAVVVPDGEAMGHACGEAAKAAPHALAGSRHCRGRRRLGSSASKRVARSAAWRPTHSALQWSRATKTAAWPSPVQVVVRSVPQSVSTAAGMMVPSWARGPRGAPTRFP
jgi:hypothetical protein